MSKIRDTGQNIKPTTKVKQFIWCAVSAISREEIQYLKVQQMSSMSKS